MKLAKEKLRKLRSLLTWKKIPAIIALIISCFSALAGFTMLGTGCYLAIYQPLFFLLGISFIVVGIGALRNSTHRRKIARLLMFAGVVLLVALSIAYIPSSISLKEYGFSAAISNHFLFSFGIVLFGLIGAALALGALYDFSPFADQNAAYLFLIVAILLVIYPLAIIIGQVIINGAPGITWEFLTQDVRNLGQEGGIFPAIVGTLLLMMLIFFIAIPLGVGSAIYLEEYAGGHFIVRIIKTAVNILRGVPSIVFGLFAFSFFVPIFGPSFLTGGLTLSCYALPMIIRASGEALKSIPQSLREGSYALGATKWQTIKKVVLPSALPGIITGAVLGIGEAAGETAPLLFIGTFTGVGFPPSLFDRVQALPTHLYTLFGMRGFKDVMQNAWATGFVLLVIILTMNAIAIIIREKYRKEF